MFVSNLPPSVTEEAIKERFGSIGIIKVIIYKQQVLHSDWLRACHLIPNQCKKVKLSAKS